MSHSKLSVQLYTVREAMSEDVPGTLQRISEIGFTQVEPYNFDTVAGLGEALRDANLTAPTAHAHFVGEDDRLLENLFAAARDLDIPTVIDPHVPAERWQKSEDVIEIAGRLNAAAKIGAKYGRVIGYHNHAHELLSVIDGETALQLFVRHLGPEVVLEIDTYWAAVGGQDPVEVLGELGDRVVAIHVKDGPGTPETKDQVPVGQGSLPIADIIAASPKALRVIELDDSRTDRFDAIAASYDYLVKENLG